LNRFGWHRDTVAEALPGERLAGHGRP
jgi:hypothetical protein